MQDFIGFLILAFLFFIIIWAVLGDHYGEPRP